MQTYRSDVDLSPAGQVGQVCQGCARRGEQEERKRALQQERPVQPVRPVHGSALVTGDEKLVAHRQTGPLASPEESVGDLASLLRDPRLIAEISADRIPALIGHLERLKAALWTRLCVPQRIGGGGVAD